MDTPESPVSDEFTDDDEFEKFFRHNTQYVEEVFAKFEEPDDDLQFLAVFDCAEGLLLGPGAEYMRDNDSKQLLSELLAQTAKQVKPTRYGLMTSNWGVDSRIAGVTRNSYNEWRAEHPDASLSEHPHAIEMVVVLSADWSGKVRAVFARINRDGINPPTLEPWESFGEFNWLNGDTSQHIESRFLDPVMMQMTGADRRRQEAIDEIIKDIPPEVNEALQTALLEMFGSDEAIPDSPNDLDAEQLAELMKIMHRHMNDSGALETMSQTILERMRTIG